MTDLFCENLRRWQAGRAAGQLPGRTSDLGFPIRGGGYPLWADVVDRFDALKRRVTLRTIAACRAAGFEPRTARHDARCATPHARMTGASVRCSSDAVIALSLDVPTSQDPRLDMLRTDCRCHEARPCRPRRFPKGSATRTLGRPSDRCAAPTSCWPLSGDHRRAAAELDRTPSPDSPARVRGAGRRLSRASAAAPTTSRCRWR